MNLYESISNEIKRSINNLPQINSIVYQAVENIKDKFDLDCRIIVDKGYRSSFNTSGRYIPNYYTITDKDDNTLVQIEVVEKVSEDDSDDFYRFQIKDRMGVSTAYLDVPKSTTLPDAIKKVEKVLTAAMERAGKPSNVNLDDEITSK